MPKISLLGSYKFRIHIFDRGSCWRKQRWNSLYGHISRENAPVHTSTGARARAQPSTRFIRLHGKNVSKLCFWLWGKEPCSASRRTQRYVNTDAVCFSRAATEFLKCVCWRMFYKQGPVRCWIFTSFDNERWSSPSYKRFRSWFRTADGKGNGIKHIDIITLTKVNHGCILVKLRIFCVISKCLRCLLLLLCLLFLLPWYLMEGAQQYNSA